jgi:hypothetical protein
MYGYIHYNGKQKGGETPMGKQKKSNGKVDRLASYINLVVAILNLILVVLLLIEKLTG